MPKRKSNPRHKASPADPRPLFMAVVTDLMEPLAPFNPEKMISVIYQDTDGRVFRGFVSQLLADAESNLHAVSTESYAALRQVHALVSKNVHYGASPADKRKRAAVDKFVASERKMRVVNRRLRWFSRRWSRLAPLVRETVSQARLDLFNLIGPFTPDDLQAMLEGCDFGPGMTYGARNRDHSLPYYKVGGGPLTVTPDAAGWLPILREVFPNWFQTIEDLNVEIREVPGNRITVVPKTAAIDRTIAIEPSFNIFLQKGVDLVLRRYLTKWGVTIRDQTRNYTLAEEGSINGRFATIDLSSASDCVSSELVRWFFPPGWSAVLDSLRSKEFTTDKGKTWTRYEKFASMGNATTFPVETLLFASVVRAACQVSGRADSPWRVYGDDLIVDQAVAALVIEVLQFLGFSTNRDKTFVFGPFRETCGRDYLRGVDVRPVYLRNVPRTEMEIYNLYNRLLANRYGFRFSSTLDYLRSLIRRPCYQPRYLLAGEEWQRWYEGKSTNVDVGFHVPSWLVKTYREWNLSIYSSVWRVPSLHMRYRPAVGEYEERLRYLTFLLGVVGGEVQAPSRAVIYRSFKRYTAWPDDGWWPDWCYAVG